jgi:hypothetical protein
VDELANELVKLARRGEYEGTISARTAEAAARLGPSPGDLVGIGGRRASPAQFLSLIFAPTCVLWR